MGRQYLVEKIVGAVCCFMGMGACGLMWREAGLVGVKRKLHLFGPMDDESWWDHPYPEGSILFAGAAYFMTVLCVLGLSAYGRQYAGRFPEAREEPAWACGPMFLILAGVAGFLQYHARVMNGVPVREVQIGFYLAMAAAGGMAVMGIIVVGKAMFATAKS
jgi:hypothetical protein